MSRAGLVRGPVVFNEREDAESKAILEHLNQGIPYKHQCFAHVLDELGIQPFTKQSVDAYRRKMIQETKWQDRREKNFFSLMGFLGVFLFIEIAAGTTIYFIITPPSWMWLIVGATALCMLCILLTVHLLHRDDRWASRLMPDSFDNDQWEDGVPLLATAMARRIKEKSPHAVFHIEQIGKPNIFFLVVSCALESYYLHAWDSKTHNSLA